MLVRSAIAVVIVCAFAAPARAQHDHAADDHHHGPTSSLAAGVSLVAASFDTMLYAGNYQGAIPSLRWARDRFSAFANVGGYRLEKNGAASYGISDVGLHGQARIVALDAFETGVVAGVSLPTGNQQRGLGMGHLMVMPAVYAAWAPTRVRVAASVGYSRALGGQSHEGHGPWPLVSPMLAEEVSWNAGADVAVGSDVTAGARASGGIPLDDGLARAIVSARVAWRAHSMESTFELQAGVVGDPFTVRGVVSTALSF